MKILVVCKKSFIEAHGANRKTLASLEPVDRARLIRADAENHRALADVTTHLQQLGVRHDVVERASLAGRRNYDLVVTLGGDGTFFTAARHLVDTPILGIKSDPVNSLGLWTCADRNTFRRPLERALEGKLQKTRLQRMALSINGKLTHARPFNDILFAHKNPAAMTRYRMRIGGRSEEQKSSGIWVATAAGSTSAIRSAGGRRMPIHSRKFQYLVREPYSWPHSRYRLVKGLTDRILITTFMVESAIWIDGSRLRKDLALGDRVEIRRGLSLCVLGFDDRRRRRLFP